MATSKPSGFDLLLMRINNNCTEPLAPGQIGFDDPTAVEDENSDTNTNITMSATAESPYGGAVTFVYGRQDLASAIAVNSVSTAGIPAWRTMGLIDFINEINLRCGTPFGVDDITGSFDLSNAPVDQATVSIQTAVQSLTLRGTSDVPIDIIPTEETEAAAASLHTYVYTTFPSLHL